MFHKIIGPRNQVAAIGQWVSPNLNLAAGGIKNTESVGPRLPRKISDLERNRVENQAFFNAFSKVIKCGFRAVLAD